jgi:uncharacterized protein DUF4242
MPICMDRHNTEGATREDCAASHEKDLATSGKYGVRFLTYWFDEVRSKAFCLVDAPTRMRFRRHMTEPTGASPTRSSKSIPPCSRRSWEGSRIRLPQVAETGPSLIRPSVRSCLPT